MPKRSRATTMTASNHKLATETKRFLNFLHNLKDEEALGGKKLINPHTAQQRELVQVIMDDEEQWQKFHLAMQQRRCTTSMGLTQNLRELIQERIREMIEIEKSRLAGSESNHSVTSSSSGDPSPL